MKRTHSRLICLLLLWWLLVLPSCKPNPIPHAASSEDQTWQAPPMLAMMFTGGGFTSSDSAWSTVPSFVLYADGRVIVTRQQREGNDITRQMVEARLSTAEVCNLLYQIADDGFLVMDSSEYVEPDATDQSTTWIVVNAWQRNVISAYGLLGRLYRNKDVEGLPAALKSTAERLLDYEPPDAQPYQVERLAIQIWPREADSAAPLWPLTQPMLAALANEVNAKSKVGLVEGQAAHDIYEQFSGSYSGIFIEDGKTYQVIIRPLLPLEEWAGDEQKGWPPPDFPYEPRTTIACSPDMAKAETAIPVTSPTPTRISLETLPQAPLQHIVDLGRRDSPGQLDSPAGLAILPQDEVLVGDARNRRFQVFSVEGEFQREIPLPDPEIWIEDFQRMADGSLYILEFGNAVKIMSPDGLITATLSGWPQERNWPDDLVVSPDRTIHLAESGGKQVVILNADGILREIWKGPDEKPFDDIMSIAADTQGNLYVASRRQNRIVKRDPQGNLQEFALKAPRTVMPLPDESFYTLSDASVTYYDAGGQFIRQWAIEGLEFPQYLARATDGSIFVMGDYFREQGNVIQRYSEDGQLLNTFGNVTAEPGQFRSHFDYAPTDQGDVWIMEMKRERDDLNTPTQLVHISAHDEPFNTFETLGHAPFTCDRYALATGPEQSVFVADPCASSIAQVNSAGKVLQRWGEKGIGSGQFNLIRSLDLMPDGQALLVVDEGNRRILQFSLDGTLQQEWEAVALAVQQPVDVARDPAGIFYLLDDATQEVIIHTGTGAVRRWRVPVRPDQHEEVNTIAFDPVHSRIYVGDTHSNLYVYDREGNLLGRKGIYGGSGVIVKLDPVGRVYASSGYDRISLFEPLP